MATIKALLLGARPQLQADGRALDLATPEEPPPRGKPSVDPSEAIANMRTHLQSLRASVLAQIGGGAVAFTATELTARTLLETDQSLEKLAQAYAATDQASAGDLRREGVRLAKQARNTSVAAGKALGIPWPL